MNTENTVQTNAGAAFHPVHNVYDGLFNTVSGKKINLHAPEPASIDIHDIACALSKICRFGGQVKDFFSVAQHCVLVAHLTPLMLRKEALMHDAAEAYVGDMKKPLKVMLPEYADIEERFMVAIVEKFSLNAHYLLSIKPFDQLATEIEHDWLQKGKRCADLPYFLNTPWSPHQAYQYFLQWAGHYDLVNAKEMML